MNFPSVELDYTQAEPLLVLDGRFVSLRALRSMTAANIRLLEKLSEPGMHGQVVRIEQMADREIKLVKMGLAAHVVRKVRGK